ncbi:hypothetical protein [Sulfurospirillum arcachonense]|uniref:hypothetical protein n=1 Tax=Sulfurospirillum arcachonense TaxID=57666 RepID=UPI0004680A03|nr:hypothetical protein [Sulfurospirillum arcachonense]
MYSPKKQINQIFTPREIKIMQKAKAYGIGTLSNEDLAKELFNLTFYVDLDKKYIQEILKLYSIFDKTVETAQISS